MSGTAMLDALRALEELIGSEGMIAARRALSADQRDELEGSTAVTWIRVDTGSALFDAAAQLCGRLPEQLIEDAVRRAADRTFNTVWRTFLRLTTDDALIKRAPLIYRALATSAHSARASRAPAARSWC